MFSKFLKNVDPRKKMGRVVATFFIAIIVFIASSTALASPESEAHYKKGNEYYDAKKYSDALIEYKSALELENTALYNNDAGWALYYLERDDDAEKFFNQSIKLDPTYPNPYRGRAWVYKRQGKLDLAKSDFNTAALMYYERKKYDTALQDFNDAIDIDKNNAEFYTNRGRTYYQLQKYDDAINDFLQAGKIFLDIKQYDKAQESFDKVLELINETEDKESKDKKKLQAEAYVGCAEAYKAMGKKHGSQKSF